MKSVSRNITVFRDEDVSLFCSDNVEELSVDEFFELVATLYEELGFANNVNIKIKGLHPSFKDTIKIRPPEFDETTPYVFG